MFDPSDDNFWYGIYAGDRMRGGSGYVGPVGRCVVVVFFILCMYCLLFTLVTQ